MESSITLGVEVPETVTNDASVTDSPGVKKVASSGRKRTRTRKADSAPKKRAAKPTEATTFTTGELEHALAEILTFPAVPCAMVGDEWGANHFSTQGRVFAANLAKQAEKNPTLHKWCVRIAQGESVGMLAMSGAMYVLPPLVHWGIIPLPGGVQGVIPGMPEPKEQDTDEPTPAAAAFATDGNVSSSSNGKGTRQERHTP